MKVSYNKGKHREGIKVSTQAHEIGMGTLTAYTNVRTWVF